MLNCLTRSLRSYKIPQSLRMASTLPVPKQQKRNLAMEVLDEKLLRPKVAVRNIPEDTFIDLTFRFGGTSTSPNVKSRLCNFHRLKDEALGRTLERMSQNLTSKNSFRSRKKLKKSSFPDASDDGAMPTVAVAAPIQLALKVNDVMVSPEIPNAFAWVDGSELIVGDTLYQVTLNPPSITNGKITTHILPEFPIDYSLDFEFAEEDQAVFVWLKHVVGTRSPVDQIPPEVESALPDLPLSLPVILKIIKDRMKPLGAWRIVSVDREWTPSADEVGASIGLLCFPIREEQVGEPFMTVAKNLVMPGVPAPVPYRRRHELCRTRCDTDSFRVISYNLLADVYGAMESSMKELFPYCPPQYMNSDYRRQLAMQEMLGYNADILCLQEVDMKHFENYFSKHFRRKGYNGFVQRKRGAISEGVATFYRTDKFHLLSQHDVSITEALFQNPIFSKMAAAINEKDKLKEIMLERGTPLQVSVLRSVDDPGRILVVGNTHLWFRPQFPHVRLIQMAVILGHIEEVVEKLKKDLDLQRGPAILICGDFNSTAGWGVHRFLNLGEIPEDFPEWKKFCKNENEFVQLALKHPFRLFSACGELAHTNFVPNFKAAIDWIYADSPSLEAISVIPVPTEEELSANTAIPSAVFPSDHLAIGCDLKWRH